MAVSEATTEAGMKLATTVVDKLDPTGLLIALFLILCILVVGLLIRQSLGKKSNDEKKLQAAKAADELAAVKTSELRHEGQGEEITALHERLKNLEVVVGVLKGEVDELRTENLQLTARVLHLEAALTNVELHFSNLVLCEACLKVNKVTLLSIERILAAANDKTKTSDKSK